MIPSNIIIIFAGAIVDIPAGFVLCDGNNGTPDLRDRFVIGAGDSYAVDDTGGSLTHTHEFTGDGHTHDIGAGAGMAGGANKSDTTDPGSAVGTTELDGELPPYYALAFIMKT